MTFYWNEWLKAHFRFCKLLMKGNSLLSLMVTDLLRKKISLETHANAHNFRDLYITKKVLSVPIEIILFQSCKVTFKKIIWRYGSYIVPVCSTTLDNCNINHLDPLCQRMSGRRWRQFTHTKFPTVFPSCYVQMQTANAVKLGHFKVLILF